MGGFFYANARGFHPSLHKVDQGAEVIIMDARQSKAFEAWARPGAGPRPVRGAKVGKESSNSVAIEKTKFFQSGSMIEYGGEIAEGQVEPHQCECSEIRGGLNEALNGGYAFM
jgi:hypothetical protein